MNDAPSIPKWECQASKLDNSGSRSALIDDSNPLTVGEKFVLICEGSSVDLDPAKLTLDLPKNAKYALRILETRQLKDGRGEFIATTWVGQPLNFPRLLLADGANKVDLGPLSIAVKSSIPQEKQQDPKPFDAYGPVQLQWPAYVWIAVAILIAIAALWSGFFTHRIIKQKRLKSLLAKNQIALTPFNHFNKDLRRIIRTGSGDILTSLKDLRESFRWYLTRELVISALSETPAQILKSLARKHPLILKALKRDLSLALNELDKAVSGTAADEADLNQLTDLCRTLADRIQNFRHSKKGG